MVCASLTVTALDKRYGCANNQCIVSPTGIYLNDPTCEGSCVVQNKYECVNSICTKTLTGIYVDDPTCNGTCQAVIPPEDNTIIYLGIAIIVGFLLLRSRK